MPPVTPRTVETAGGQIQVVQNVPYTVATGIRGPAGSGGGGGTGGGVIGSTVYAPEPGGFTPAAPDTQLLYTKYNPGELSVTFTVPASGEVIVVLAAALYMAGSGADAVSWALMLGSTQVGTRAVAGYNVAPVSPFVPCSTTVHSVTGLTPDAEVTLDWARAHLIGGDSTAIITDGAYGAASMLVYAV